MAKKFWLNKSSKRRLIRENGKTCTMCGCEMWHFDVWGSIGPSSKEATIDHIHPVSRGGQDKRENLRVACKGCNARKANKTGRGARPILSKLQTRHA